MSIKDVVAKQYKDRVNEAIEQLGSVPTRPNEGWLKTVRVALGMTGPQLAKKLGITKARVWKIEQEEPAGSLTIKTMESMAEAMECQFVYAVVPRENVEVIIRQRAIDKARSQVLLASTHMALENQSLSNHLIDIEIERVASEILQKLPSDFWDES